MDQITLELAKKMIEGAEEEANQIGVPMVISIVDEAGILSPATEWMMRCWLA